MWLILIWHAFSAKAVAASLREGRCLCVCEQRRWCSGSASGGQGAVLWLYVLVVALAVTGERVAFKMSIDKVRP